MNLRVVAVLVSLSFVGAMGCSTKTAKVTTPAPAAATPSASPSPSQKAQAQPQAVVKASGAEMVCSRGGEQRKLEIEVVEPKGCKVQYTKFGERSNVASSTVGSAHCETVRDRIKGNLEGVGFSCK